MLPCTYLVSLLKLHLPKCDPLLHTAVFMQFENNPSGGGGGLLSYISHMGMCCPKG